MEKIDLFCGLNSIGMPYTKDNKQHISYFNIVESYLKDSGFVVDGINLSRLNRNNTWDLERIFNKSYSLAKIKKLQVRSIDDMRNTNPLFKLVVPEKFKNTIKIEKNDENIKIKDVYKESLNPIFLYSTGANDFFTYIGAGPVEMLDSKIRKRMYPNVEKACEQTIINVDKNFKMLTTLNPNVKIYAMSTFYAPIFNVIAKLIIFQNKIERIESDYDDVLDYAIKHYNNSLKKLCDKYDNIYYVDINYIENYCANFDFHPTTKGNELIGRQIINEIEKNNIFEGKVMK